MAGAPSAPWSLPIEVWIRAIRIAPDSASVACVLDCVVQALACEIIDAPSASALLYEPGIEQAPEIGTRRSGRDVRLFAVSAAVGSTDEALLKRDRQSVRPAPSLDQFFQ